jgi:hypothetical protein
MPDGVDDSILKMQHLGAQAKAEMEERSARGASESLKTKAQKLAFEAQEEIRSAESALAAAEAKQAEGRRAGTPTLQAADLLTEGKSAARGAQTRLIKARARLEFALDQMDAAERNAWDALQASARADAHGQLADET